MTRFALQMISVGTLLILTCPAASKQEKCFNELELKNCTDRYEKYWNRTRISKIHAPPQGARSCAQAAAEMYGDESSRALSPWRYYYNEDANRIPYKISFAKCLCQGCIIEQQEKMTYNSVPVFSYLNVLKKTKCSSDSNQFVVKYDYIKVPVACTCVVPKSTK